ncbi:P-loop containing nucleoside triphosphate hydrolase protein [Macrolepiota fuliginosa MF-IS2]|uniref:P-loop containing nucleoside triphosphate hydrolase protein n=1 Tax=Macrolepiota fuliginosa MF-IS2 TaxID=1400762 RepID=A0A9P6C274_9AGAR|nr:P-loop containing nucleoside triphosphate hydrolase protein [Macrolepiota fuliginosa MF-IS2]
MDGQLVTCPVCNKHVRSRIINKHLDEGCSTDTTVPSSQEPVLSSPTVGDASTKKSSTALAPIFTPSMKAKNTANQPLALHSRGTDASSNISSQAKRPIEVDSPTPAAKRKKLADRRANMPLAERLRPKQLSDFIGQTHLMEQGSLLSTVLRTNATWSIILWGPPGCGKTTLAKLIAEHSDALFKELSATASGVNEVKAIVEEAKRTLSLLGRRTILFLDEIHRFNKAQQDVFLPFVEQGLIQLIGATTENPSFRLTGALLSRCRVLRLEPLSDQQMSELLKRSAQKIAIDTQQAEQPLPNDVDPSQEPENHSVLTQRIISRMVSMAGGDARTALSLLEVAVQSPKDAPEEQVMEALKQSLVVSYDRTGDDHYDMISALHKSVRGSNGSAAMYWLARMLTSGEDPLFIARRMVVCASEDIGLADNHALPLAMSTLQACQVIGMPECRINLAHLIAYLAEAPKSTRAYEAYKRAETAAKGTTTAPVPMQVRNAPTAMMAAMGYGKNYHYNPDYRHPVHNQYVPKELMDSRFLLNEGDTSGKVWDEQALCEWEANENGGQKWAGRVA